MRERAFYYITHNPLPTLVLLLIALGVIGFGAYQYQNISTRLELVEAQLASTTAELAETTQERDILSEAFYSEQQKNEQLEDEIDTLSKTLDTLEKLQRLDRELLQKYSRIYFLNEHYQPDALTQIDGEFTYPEGDLEYIHTDVWPFLRRMLNEAEDDGIDLRILSAYRSFEHQDALLSNYTVTYGQGANQFSAAQGYSEHQLGTTVDFTTPQLGTLQGFSQTEAYDWLLENAHRFGFILSYPQDNAYYQFEPWHWRFVGVELASDLHGDEQHFYDLEQQEIDKYLLDIFDR